MLVVVFRKKDEDLREIETKGHAGFGFKGRDIVCAAVSALLETAIFSLEKELPREAFSYSLRNGYANLRFFYSRVGEKDREKLRLLQRVIGYGIEGIAQRYPNFLRVVEEVE